MSSKTTVEEPGPLFGIKSSPKSNQEVLDRSVRLVSNLSNDTCLVFLQHYKEANCHRLAVEELLHRAGVDLVFAGMLSSRLYNPLCHISMSHRQ